MRLDENFLVFLFLATVLFLALLLVYFLLKVFRKSFNYLLSKYEKTTYHHKTHSYNHQKIVRNTFSKATNNFESKNYSFDVSSAQKTKSESDATAQQLQYYKSRAEALSKELSELKARLIESWESPNTYKEWYEVLLRKNNEKTNHIAKLEDKFKKFDAVVNKYDEIYDLDIFIEEKTRKSSLLDQDIAQKQEAISALANQLVTEYETIEELSAERYVAQIDHFVPEKLREELYTIRIKEVELIKSNQATAIKNTKENENLISKMCYQSWHWLFRAESALLLKAFNLDTDWLIFKATSKNLTTTRNRIYKSYQFINTLNTHGIYITREYLELKIGELEARLRLIEKIKYLKNIAKTEKSKYKFLWQDRTADSIIKYNIK